MQDVDTQHGARWEFNGDVVKVFDEMLERSIPQYQTMRRSVFEIGKKFNPSRVIDLGCSRGEALAPFVDEFRDGKTSFVGCEVSEPMLEVARERFLSEPDVLILEHDLRQGFPQVGPVGLTLAVLTLQFVPINYRQEILRGAYEATEKGGALILVEKVLGSGARIDKTMVEMYHRAKNEAGYSREEIERKALALEGVLVPVTAEWNVELLRKAGFTEVDCFYRWMNFAGWVALK